jgi:hypothetical protein
MVKTFTIESCPTVDSFASNAVSIPHYLSKSANYMVLKSIEELNDKTRGTLNLILTGSENLIIFAIDMIIGTYACVLISTVDGAVDVAVNSTEYIIGWVNDTLGDITNEIEDGLTDLSKVINTVVSAAEKVKDIFTDDDDDDDATDSFNKVNLTISGLKNLHIPSSINDKLENLKEKTLDFETVRNKTEGLIRTPFDIVKAKINESTFIASNEENSLYVPPLVSSKICSDNTDKINAFYDDVNQDIAKLLKIFVTLLLVAAVLALVPIIWEDIRHWKKLQNLETNLREAKDPIESYEAAFNKYPTKAGIILSKLSKPEKNKTTIRWIAAYSLSSRSLVVLGIGLAGLLAVVFQFLVLHALTKSIDNNKAPFGNMTQDLAGQMDLSMKTWTNSTNDFILSKQNEMNDDLFSMVKTTTTAVNNTVSSFVEEMNEVISDAFGGTILYNPVKTIVGCVIENKLLKIEQGLTWVHDHAEITLPKVSEDFIAKGIESSSDGGEDTGLVSKSQELVSQTEDMMMRLLRSTIKAYKKTLMMELYITLAILAIWLLQIIIAIIVGFVDNVRSGAEEDNHFYKQNDGRPWNISNPRELTRDEQTKYGYPFTDPLSGYDLDRSITIPRDIDGEKSLPVTDESLCRSQSTETIDSSFPHNFGPASTPQDIYSLGSTDSHRTLSELFVGDSPSRVLSGSVKLNKD